MKKSIQTTLFFLLLMNMSFAQKTDFITSQFDDVTRIGLVNKPTLDNYPYMAVSVLFRNEDKLSDKKFLGNFKKMSFFSTDVEISYDGGKPEKCPLYFLKKEKGKFSTTVFKDRTVVKKIPIRKYSVNIPTININTDIKIKNEAVAIIKGITDKVAPIIQNPASIYGAGAAQLCFGFLTDVVSQLNESKEINAKVGFDAFSIDELGILPYSYKVVILRPNVPIYQDGYTIKIAEDKKLKLFHNDTIYNDYPYFIIQTGLSNYLDDPSIPSSFYRGNGNCNISENELNKLYVQFDATKTKLSVDQLAAENNLLDLYKYKLIIENGVASQGGTSPNEEKLLNAYNALYDFRYQSAEMKINPILFKEHYEDIFKNLMTCIESTSNQLSMFKFLKPVFAVLDKEVNSIDNSDLGELKSYIENTKTLNFIVKSNFNSNAITTITSAENRIFNAKFDNIIKTILSANDLTGTIQNDIKTLISAKNQYDKCSRCQEESQKAEKFYNELVNTERYKRTQILEVVDKANETYSKGYSAIQKLEFSLTKTTDSITGKSSLISPISIDDFKLTLNKLKDNKEKLNSKLSLTNFSQIDKIEIDQVIVKCNTAINEINTILDTKLVPLFEQTIKIFTSN